MPHPSLTSTERPDAPAPGSTCPECNGWARREPEPLTYECVHGHRWPFPSK